MKPEERAAMEKQVDEIYRRFLDYAAHLAPVMGNRHPVPRVREVFL